MLSDSRVVIELGVPFFLLFSIVFAVAGCNYVLVLLGVAIVYSDCEFREKTGCEFLITCRLRESE